MSLINLYLAFLALVPWLVDGQTTRPDLWTQINVIPVCFEGRGDRPGHVVYTGPGRLVGAIKLVYKSGHIRCDLNEAFKSRWGCYQLPALMNSPLDVIITDYHDNVILPLPKYHRNPGYRPGLWYWLPATDSLHSDELVFTNYLDPFYLAKDQSLKIWFGEDLRNWQETDNVGRVCVDVFAHML